jgi:hypothetical protein
MRVNPRRCMGGEGVGWVVRYLWSLPYTEKAKLKKGTKWNNLNEEEEDQREASR